MSTRTSKILASLPYFVAVAEELHFGRAAERLGMTQPPLTRRIQNLEQELGTALFYRTRQQAVLTDAGAALFHRAEALLDQMDVSIEEVRRISRGLAGQIRIGCVSSALYSVLPAVVREFSKKNPGIEVSLFELPTIAQIQQLQQRQIDVGILRSPADDRSLRTTSILKERMVAILPLDHSLAKRRELRLLDLKDEGFVMYSKREVPRLRELILRRCEAIGFQPRIVQETTQIPTMISFVTAGLGVALIPESSRHGVGASAKVVSLRGESIEVELMSAMLRSNISTIGLTFVRTAVAVGKHLA
jgi:DNA-binding transcriptional LysR family regulator